MKYVLIINEDNEQGLFAELCDEININLADSKFDLLKETYEFKPLYVI